MCGIAGIADFEGRAIAPELLHAMTALVRHRGPDGEGIWFGRTGAASAGLGHRRLAVLDLRECAAQPMHNAACVTADRASPLTLVFNGEIYNFQELRADLTSHGHRFLTRSDAEVLLHLYEELGPAMVHRLRGMFAFALWDEKTGRLFCARDRVGKKPFYYRYAGGRFWFASEPRAMLADPDVPLRVDPSAIRAYLTLGYVPGDRSAFSGLRCLPPGCWITVDASGLREQRYWTLEYEPKRLISESDALAELRDRLTESVRLRLVSDVPLGAFLSGGTDSSAIVALMTHANARVRTFSIGFEEADYNELPYARLVAGRYGADHHEYVVRPDAAALAPALARHYGEPYGDSSAIPMYCLAQLARRHITVALNGDGGDESFAGYRRYQAHALADLYRRVPAPVRRILAAGAGWRPAPNSRGRLYDIQRFLVGTALPDHARYAGWFGFFGAEAPGLTPSFAESTAGAGLDALEAAFDSDQGLGPVDAAMRADVSTYLPDDLLVKVDRATMAHGLEARSPLLDHTVMEFAARLPVNLKVSRFRKKHLLRRLCGDLVPREILSRPKTGFGVPLDRWFRAELSGFVRDILTPAGTMIHQYVQPVTIERLIQDHHDGRAAHGHRLWALVMLELWHRICLVRPTGAETMAVAAPGEKHQA